MNMSIINKRNSESKKNPPFFSSCFSYSNVEPRTVSDKDAVRFAVSASNLSSEKKVLGSITKSNSKTSQSHETQALEQKQANRRLTYQLKNTSAKLLPSERVNHCLNNRVNIDRGVDVKIYTQTGRAGYGNLMRCDSVWVCPCCHGRIMSHRGSEVEQAVKTWTEAGGSVFMLTLTHSHQLTDNLSDKLKKMRRAVSRLFSDRAMREVWEGMGRVGQIRALEVTRSESNGWHPHHHYLIFTKRSRSEFTSATIAVTGRRSESGSLKLVTLKREQKLIKKGQIDDIFQVSFEEYVKHYWVKICRDVGLGEPSLVRGATVQDASSVKTYLTKIKSAQELVNSTAKLGKNGSRTQWQILADADNGDEYSAKLWQEYAMAFKSERQLFWSRGLKKLLLIDDVEDSEIEELGDISDDEIITIADISIENWSYIRRKKWQAHLLDIVENDYKNDTDNLTVFLYSIAYLRAKEQSEYEQRELERIRQLVPPHWFEDLHSDLC